MIAFGCSITSRETFDDLALSGIRRASEPDSIVLDWDSTVIPYTTYNSMLDELAGRDEIDVLSPWAMRELRYDESVNAGGVHGCDVDICFQARAAGKKVVVDELGTVHHQGKEVLGDDTDPWIEAHVRFARKWASMVPQRDGGGGGAPERGRLARRLRFARGPFPPADPRDEHPHPNYAAGDERPPHRDRVAGVVGPDRGGDREQDEAGPEQ
jgi:hypothetical protein